MSPIPPNSEVWVIHGAQAKLFRKREQIWEEEMNMPFAEFVGSATALSSFTLPETRVYLNVGKADEQKQSTSDRCWVGIEQDPLRLREVQYSPTHHEQLHDVKSMGKKALLICTTKAENFERATEVMLLEQQEHQHLKQWLKNQKSGGKAVWCSLRLFAALWTTPETSYRHLRLVAIACTASAILLMNWNTQDQLKQQAVQTRQSILDEQSKPTQKTVNVSLTPWSAQINKFGQENRANLQALSIHWDSHGEVHSFAQLERPRKRVPKGCALVSPVRAECLSNTEKP